MQRDVLMIGLGISYPAHTDFFISQKNLYEYRTIVWRVPTLVNELAAGNSPDGVDGLMRLSFVRFRALYEWVIAGNTLTVIGCRPFHVPRFAILYPLQPPLDGIEFSEAHGSKIESCGSPEINDLLRPQIPMMHYESLLAGTQFIPFLQVSQPARGAPQFVGGYRRLENGLVIYLPEIASKKGQEGDFVELVEAIPKTLKPSPATLPNWVKEFQTSDESRLHAEIAAEEISIKESQSKIDDHRDAIAGHDQLKQLFSATGKQFEEAVADALRELGLAVVAGPNSRADLMASNGQQYAAIEAKGVEGSCRESHLREVGVWTAEVDLTLSMLPDERGPDQKSYWEGLKMLPMKSGGPEANCKGILVVNTYRTLPLDERTEPDFPDAMKRRISTTGVCALTGLQLFGLVLEIRKAPTAKSKIVKALFETRGVLALASDWRGHLSVRGTR